MDDEMEAKQSSEEKKTPSSDKKAPPFVEGDPDASSRINYLGSLDLDPSEMEDIRIEPHYFGITVNDLIHKGELHPSQGLYWSVSETAQERMERKLDELREQVATKEDIINQTNHLIETRKKENEKLLEKIKTLRGLSQKNLIHNRLARYSSLFLAFFVLSFLSSTFLGVTVVTPLWNDLGLLFSIGFLAMAWYLGMDWKVFKKKDG